MKRLILIATGALALLAATAAPVGAGGHAASSAVCADASPFSSLSALTASKSTARGWNRDAPARLDVGDSEYDSGLAPNVPPGFTVKVPTYVHVITDGRVGNLTNSQIRRQIDVLNLSFAGFYGGANSGFSFELKGVTRTDNADWFTMNDFADEVEAKTALRRGGPDALNIYTGTAAGNLGFAYYPSILKWKQYAILDGIVIHYGSVPGGFIDRFNLGYTATHEVGHWLGLAHTFDFGCWGDGDRVDDTPAMLEPTSGCPEGKDTCVKEPGLDPIHNYMDYSDDPCYNQFTPGQAARAQAQFIHFRTGRY